jgi:hypothetical protein
VAISEYIGSVFNNNSYKERLTASAKTFNVPVTINGNLTVTGTCRGCSAGTGSSHHTASLSDQSAPIGATNICESTPCEAGQYRISYYLDATSVCSSPGDAATSLTIGWKDETTKRSMKVPLAGSGIFDGDSVKLGATANFGTGEISLWLGADTKITYSTSYTACSSGSAKYALRIVAQRVQ